MRLRLSIYRDGFEVAATKALWNVEDGPKTFAQLLEDINCNIPLILAKRNLSDYVVDFAGFEGPGQNSV